MSCRSEEAPEGAAFPKEEAPALACEEAPEGAAFPRVASRPRGVAPRRRIARGVPARAVARVTPRGVARGVAGSEVVGAVLGALEEAAERAEPPDAIEEPPASAEKHAPKEESSQAELPRERRLEWLAELRAELRPLVERPRRERGSLAGPELPAVLAP